VRVNRTSAHHLRGDSEEVRPAPPVHLALIDEPQVRLVNQRRRLERVPLSLSTKLPPRDTAQFLIHEWQQLIEGARVSTTPVVEQRRDVRGRAHRCKR